MDLSWVRLAAPLAVLLALTACTGGDPPTETTLDRDPDDVLASELEFIACMRDQGIEMVDPIPGDDSGRSALKYEIDVNGKGSDPTFQAALDECVMLLPPPEARAEPDPEDLAREQEFAQCMRDNGVPEMPDPRPGKPVIVGETDPPPPAVMAIKLVGGGIVVIDPDDPVVVAALELCQRFLPEDLDLTGIVDE